LLRLTFSKELMSIDVNNIDNGCKMAGSITCTCEASAPLEIGINGNYFSDALEHLHGDEIEFELQDGGLTPIVLKSETTTHVVTPIRV
jgi:DNA polymerase III sliding clamp (beta) subunit (PCNA family)